jgi:hypothetical protein
MRRLLPPVVMVASMATVAALWLDPPGAPLAHTSPTATTSSTSSTWPAPTTTTWTLPPTTTTSTTDPTVFAQWSRVAVCEEGGWVGSAGAKYPDSLGISAANWSAFGGGADLSPGAQIAVAQRIEAAAGLAGFVPDQAGCAAW